MTKKPGKSRAKKGPPQPSRARMKVAKGAAAKPAVGATAEGAATREPLDDFIDAAALALDLPIEAVWRSTIKANLAATLRLAALVEEFPLPDDAEPAPVFEA